MSRRVSEFEALLDDDEDPFADEEEEVVKRKPKPPPKKKRPELPKKKKTTAKALAVELVGGEGVVEDLLDEVGTSVKCGDRRLHLVVGEKAEASLLLYYTDSALSFKKLQELVKQRGDTINAPVRLAAVHRTRKSVSKVPQILVQRLCTQYEVSGVDTVSLEEPDTVISVLTDLAQPGAAKVAVTLKVRATALSAVTGDFELERGDAFDVTYVSIERQQLWGRIEGNEKKFQEERAGIVAASQVGVQSERSVVTDDGRVQVLTPTVGYFRGRLIAIDAPAAPAAVEKPKPKPKPKLKPKGGKPLPQMKKKKQHTKMAMDDKEQINLLLKSLKEKLTPETHRKVNGKKLKRPLTKCWRACDAVEALMGGTFSTRTAALGKLREMTRLRCFVNASDASLMEIGDDEDLWRFWADVPERPALNASYFFSAKQDPGSPLDLSAELLDGLLSQVRQHIYPADVELAVEWFSVEREAFERAVCQLQQCKEDACTLSFWINVHNLLAVHQAVAQLEGSYVIDRDVYTLKGIRENIMALDRRAIFLLSNCTHDSPAIHILDSSSDLERLIDLASSRYLQIHAKIDTGTGKVLLPAPLAQFKDEPAPQLFAWLQPLMPAGTREILNMLVKNNSATLAFAPPSADYYAPKLPLFL